MTRRLRYRLCVAVFGVLAACASAARGQAIDSTAVLARSDVPAFERLFCAYYEKAAKVSSSAEERMKVAIDVEWAQLQFAERAWLLYMICDPSVLPKEGVEAQTIAGGGTGSMNYPEPEPKDEGHECYSTGLTLTTVSDPNAPDRVPWLSTVTLHIFKSVDAPDVLGVIFDAGERPDPRKFVDISQPRQLPVPDAEEMNRLLADPVVGRFCVPYLRACAASSDEEKASRAGDIAASSLSGQEKAFILFKMLSPGMNAGLARRIAGAGAGYAPCHAALLKVIRENGCAKVVKEHDQVPMSMYGNGICLALSDKEPSTLVQASLKASRTATRP